MPIVIPVRIHFNAQDLWFSPGDTQAKAADHVVVSTERGTEFGLATADPFSVPDSELKGKGELKPVLRVATDDDVRRAEELSAQGEAAMPVFRQAVKASGLDIKPVGVEFLFGGEKAVFYFAAEDRVDFRELVRDLAGKFHQRVDMRQIGVRDEARLAGGYAPCGQELCCVRFGGQFQPVSIRMAKEQDLPLNSSKISGVCGRLMCCLRYEFDAYRDFKQRAPKKNNLIDTPLGKAKIVEYNTPKETLTLRLENGKSFTVALKDMTCSEGCCKRAKEQNIPLRPDTVTREALEALGTAEMAMQLAELDRANGEAGGYALDDSLLEGRRTPRKRKTDRPEKAEEPVQGRRPRRQSKPGAAPEGADAQKDGKPEERREEPKRGPRGGGMRPRRTQKAPAEGKRAQQGQAGGANNAAAEQPAKPRRQASQGKPEAKQERPRTAEGQAEPQKRTRRHHSAAAGATGTAAQPASAAPQHRTRQHAERDAAKPAEGARGRQGGEQAQPAAQPAGGQATRRRHTKAQGGQAQAQPQAQPSQPRQQGGEQPSGQQTRRRRRPGDKGGAANE